MKDQLQRALDELEAQEALSERLEDKCRCYDCQNAVYPSWSRVSGRLGYFNGGYCAVADAFIATDDSALSMSCDQFYEAE